MSCCLLFQFYTCKYLNLFTFKYFRIYILRLFHLKIHGIYFLNKMILRQTKQDQSNTLSKSIVFHLFSYCIIQFSNIILIDAKYSNIWEFHCHKAIFQGGIWCFQIASCIVTEQYFKSCIYISVSIFFNSFLTINHLM